MSARPRICFHACQGDINYIICCTVKNIGITKSEIIIAEQEQYYYTYIVALRSPLVILSWFVGSSVHTQHMIISLTMYFQCTAVIVHGLYINFEFD